MTKVSQSYSDQCMLSRASVSQGCSTPRTPFALASVRKVLPPLADESLRVLRFEQSFTLARFRVAERKALLSVPTVTRRASMPSLCSRRDMMRKRQLDPSLGAFSCLRSTIDEERIRSQLRSAPSGSGRKPRKSNEFETVLQTLSHGRKKSLREKDLLNALSRRMGETDMDGFPAAAWRRVSSGVPLSSSPVADLPALATEVKGTRKLSTLAQDSELCEVLEGHNVGFIMERLTSTKFSATELRRMENAYSQKVEPGNNEIYVEDLEEILTNLGYFYVDRTAINECAAEVTIFSTISFDEYLHFMNIYAALERAKLRASFATFDEDGSGFLSSDEVTQVFASLGITPLRATIEEAIEQIDKGSKGTLDFWEYIELLALYRDSEGFSHFEVKELHWVFIRFADPSEEPGKPQQLCIDKLVEALTFMFGTQSVDIAKDLVAKMRHTHTVGCSDGFGFVVDSPVSRSPQQSFNRHTSQGVHAVCFRDFLALARRLREQELLDYRQMFARIDKAGSGRIKVTSLRSILESLGLMPLPAPLQESLKKVTTRDTLDFEEFFNFMVIYRRSDGFTDGERQAFLDAFRLYQDEESGEVTFANFMELLQYIGYRHGVETCKQMLALVDDNGNGLLGEQEFFRLMRLLREHDLKDVKIAFETFFDEGTKLLPLSSLEEALAPLGMSPSADDMRDFFKVAVSPAGLDFNEFVGLFDIARASYVRALRKNASFTDEEVVHLREAFERYDKNHNGTIENIELSTLIQDLQLPFAKREDQRAFVELIVRARAEAKQSGLGEEVNLGADDSPDINFTVFLYILRIVRRNEHKKGAIRWDRLLAEANFSDEDTAGFNEVFDSWAGHSKKSFQRPTIGLIDFARSTQDPMMPIDSAVRLLSSLGLRIVQKDVEPLRKFVAEFGKPGTEMLDFPCFLCMMRWLLDSNFCSIKSILPTCAPALQPTASISQSQMLPTSPQGGWMTSPTSPVSERLFPSSPAS